MKTQSSAKPFGFIRLSIALLAAMVFGVLAATSASAAPLTINVVGVDTTLAVRDSDSEYRWTVEEDATKASIPGKPADSTQLLVQFPHQLHAGGRSGRVGTSMAHPAMRYRRPRRQRSRSGRLPRSTSRHCPTSIPASATSFRSRPTASRWAAHRSSSATERRDGDGVPQPVPACRRRRSPIFVFNDNNPINGAPDLPQETGLAGFHVHLIEAGGTYGASGGEVTQDAFGNPLGTTYNADWHRQGSAAAASS